MAAGSPAEARGSGAPGWIWPAHLLVEVANPEYDAEKFDSVAYLVQQDLGPGFHHFELGHRGLRSYSLDSAAGYLLSQMGSAPSVPRRLSAWQLGAVGAGIRRPLECVKRRHEGVVDDIKRKASALWDEGDGAVIERARSIYSGQLVPGLDPGYIWCETSLLEELIGYVCAVHGEGPLRRVGDALGRVGRARLAAWPGGPFYGAALRSAYRAAHLFAGAVPGMMRRAGAGGAGASGDAADVRYAFDAYGDLERRCRAAGIDMEQGARCRAPGARGAGPPAPPDPIR